MASYYYWISSTNAAATAMESLLLSASSPVQALCVRLCAARVSWVPPPLPCLCCVSQHLVQQRAFNRCTQREPKQRGPISMAHRQHRPFSQAMHKRSMRAQGCLNLCRIVCHLACTRMEKKASPS